MATPRKQLLMSDVSSSFDSSGNMDISMEQNTPVRQSVHLSKGKLFTGMPLSPLVNKSSGGSNLENHGFLIVRKRRSLMASSPRQRNTKDKENFDLTKDNLCSSMVDSNEEDDDDEVFTALQTIAKKPLIKVDRSILKRKSPDADNSGTPRRTRRCLSLSSPPKSRMLMKRNRDQLLLRKRSKSVTENNIPSIFDVPLDRRNLIGDFSGPHTLPIMPGKHSDLAYISSHTLAKALSPPTKKNILIIDARYPYEFEGGHITSAYNFFIAKEIDDFFFREECIEKRQRTILVFHCEFSSERGPRQLRYLRACDRTRNPYPKLHYPEIYLLYGGYKEFFKSYRNLCEPSNYLPMAHADYVNEYKMFRKKTHE